MDPKTKSNAATEQKSLMKKKARFPKGYHPSGSTVMAELACT